MRTLRPGAAGLLFCTLCLAAAAFAQGTSGTNATTEKAAEPPAKAEAAADQPAQAKPAASRAGGTARTIVGEVLEPGCYLVNGAHGENHKECAMACAKAGQTLALLEKKTNKLYLLVSDHPGEDPNRSVIDYVAQTVTIKGRVFTRGGVTGIMVVSVEPGGGKGN
ncbi:MAG TPA: hypothetical protein VID50_02620 [Candidatus Eisenbacteria bacterium]|jgi:hypothetical protein